MTNVDSRAAKRLRVLKSAKIIYNFSQSVMDCTVRDMSGTGAKIICANNHLLPDDIRIVFMQDNTIRDAKVMWRRGEQIGIKFTSDPQRAPPRKFTT
jgi:PilZ domain